MLSVTIVAVGKIKEDFYRSAVSEYAKRLSAYCHFDVIEVKDEKTPENPTETEKRIILEREGKRILDKIPKGTKVIALCIEGKQLSSEELADTLSNLSLSGVSRVVFVIGGSMGLSDEVKNLASIRLSFSKMTFPHMLMRVILAEQIYRGFTIIEGKTYHK